LLVLALAKSPAPLDYISLHTGIEEPHEILEKMEEEGLVRRSPPASWSCSMVPMYEITPTTQKELPHVLF
ncbi:MAG: hypothetical protein QXG97_03145, partial [Nitrososphaerota archaeon]